MSVASSVAAPVVRSCVRSVLARRGGKRFPSGAILHYDADIDPFIELTGGPHTFNHAVLSPQFQRNADGSYSNVGAKPAVDVFGGEKWLRSCGAVTNLLTNSVFAGAVSGTPGVAPTGWTLEASTGTLAADGVALTFTANAARHFLRQSFTVAANTTYLYGFNIDIPVGTHTSQIINIVVLPAGASASLLVDGSISTTISAGKHFVEALVVIGGTVGTVQLRAGIGCSSNDTGAVTISNPQLTATAYPLPYVPTTTAGPVTQPASNATTTNGMWFSLPDGSPVWQALTGQPLTLATRVRMGVGSGDLAGGSGDQNIIASRATSGGEQFYNRASLESGVGIARSYDGTTAMNITGITWPRNAIILRATQVNTDGTQFRVGCMIEGTHTEIQWSGWANYDSSFNPSTLCRLILGYANAYPMWFNKITVWKEQVDDARILEAMA